MVDEFTAALLLELVEAEMERLKTAQDACRDAFDPEGWARIRLAVHGFHRVWSQLHSSLYHLGEPTQEVLESRDKDIQRMSHEIPRSKANSAAWRAVKASERTQREALRAPSKRRGW